MMKTLESNILERLDHLNRIGVALSKETDINRLLETILIVAKNITMPMAAHSIVSRRNAR